jgi:hypothetical protein
MTAQTSGRAAPLCARRCFRGGKAARDPAKLPGGRGEALGFGAREACGFSPVFTSLHQFSPVFTSLWGIRKLFGIKGQHP